MDPAKRKDEPAADSRGDGRLAPLKDRVLARIERALDALGPAVGRPEARVEYAREEKFGDYACTVAMDKRFREAYSDRASEFRNPRAFAGALVEALEALEKSEALFARIEIAGPGFINLTLNTKALLDFTLAANLHAKEYGRSAASEPQRILFEFVSANPTGPLNVVSARAAALGDSICNLLEAAGQSVHREYYVNDHGNQVELLGHSCLLRELQARGIELLFASRGEDGSASYSDGPGLAFPAEGYHGEYLGEITARVIAADPALAPDDGLVARARELAATNGPRAAERAAEVFLAQADVQLLARRLGRAVLDHFLRTQQRDLETFRVQFDEFYRESQLHESGAVLAVAEDIAAHVFEEDGKQLFRSTDFGDDKDRVIIRDDGRPTYLLADIAYHKTKLERGYQRIINIWGPDHHGYIQRLSGAMTALGAEAGCFSVLIAQQVNLLEDGRPVVMSKRTGRFITMETLLEEIPVDVSRYFFVMRAPESHLDFDFTEARDTSEKNPYYYVAYAHARIRSIFARAAELGLAPPADGAAVPAIEWTEERRRLLFLVARFPEEVRDAALAFEPHRLVTFLYQLAGALSRFYGPKENKIIEQKPEVAGTLLLLLQATAVCIKNGLLLLGMEAPERMSRADD